MSQHSLLLPLCVSAALLAGCAASPSSRDDEWVRVSTDQIHDRHDHHKGHKSHKGRDHDQPLPKGLQKKAARGKPLPPGWQRKLAVGQVIPDDIWAHRDPVPRDVLATLPPARKGVITVRIEGKLIRLIEATREVVEILQL